MSPAQPAPRLDATYSLEWHSPYTDPPDGRPRVLATHEVEDYAASDHRCPEWLDKMHWANPGYSIYVLTRWVNKPDRSWSKERKAQRRRLNLRKRIEKRWPMFAEMMIAEEMARYPSYYAGEEYNGRNRE